MTRTASSVTETLLHIDSPYDEDSLAHIAWATIAAPGDRTACALVDQHGPIEALEYVFRRNDVVADIAANRLRMSVGGALPTDRVAAAIQETLTRHLAVLTPSSRCWPTGLNNLAPAAPFALWVHGDPNALRRPGILVVGAKQMSPTGLHTCLDFVSQSAQLGYAIYTTADNGIPTVALLAALAVNGSAGTVIPTSHSAPANCTLERTSGRLTERGATVSELAPCLPPGTLLYTRRTWVTVASAAAVVALEPTYSNATGREPRTRHGAHLSAVNCAHVVSQSARVRPLVITLRKGLNQAQCQAQALSYERSQPSLQSPAQLR